MVSNPRPMLAIDSLLLFAALGDPEVLLQDGFEDRLCEIDAECSGIGVAPTCTPATCQGQGQAGLCSEGVCEAAAIEDDTVCGVEILAVDCGLYADVYCTGEADQATPVCATGCFTNDDCDSSAHCAEGLCEPGAPQGGACDQPGQCAAGLTCVDSVCCTSACSGSCEACDVEGFEGACSVIGDGEDPDMECGAFSCSGYYWGWDGDTCYASGHADEEAVSCNGGGSCQTPSTVCLLTGQGNAALTCSGDMAPDLATCSGSTAPVCMVAPGSVSGQVWLDENANGQQSGGELGVPDITVLAYADADMDGLPDAASLASTTTDVNGNYRIDGLLGNVVLRAEFPGGCPSVGPDSQNDGITGYSFTVMVSPGSDITEINLGVTLSCP